MSKRKLNLGNSNPWFAPDITLLDEEGDEFVNLEAEGEDEQIRIHYRYCDDEKAYDYIKKKKGMQIKSMVKDFCNKITGPLSELGITDGKSLCSADKTDAVLSMIEQTFKKITRFDQKVADQEEDD